MFEVHFSRLAFSGVLSLGLGTMSMAQDAGLMGLPGPIDMPTARMTRDAELGMTFALLPEARRTVLAFQIQPWLQGALRYSGIGDQGGFTQKSGYSLWDRSFDLRARLLREGAQVPEITLGVQDIIGTGVMSGEYVVATKSVGADIEVTAGLGWGRYGAANTVFQGGSRPGATGGAFGGEVRLESLFRGDVGAFGGVTWRTPIDGLTAQAEISSDDYSREAAYGVDKSVSQLNLGLRYRLNSHFTVGAYQVQGRGLALQLSGRIDPFDPPAQRSEVRAPRPLSADAVARPETRLPVGPDGAKAVAPSLHDSMRADGLRLLSFDQSGTACRALIENYRYGMAAQAIGRAVRDVAMQPGLTCPDIEVTLARDGLQVSRVRIKRAQVHQLDQGGAAVQRLAEGAVTGAAATPWPDWQNAPRLEFSFGPYGRYSLFDPDQPVYLDVGLRAQAQARLGALSTLKGSIAQSVVGNYDDMFRGPKGNLAKVRTDHVAYAKGGLGGVRIEKMYLEQLGQVSDRVFLRATAGYLEDMYAGLSTEVLWWAPGSAFAFGAEVNAVRARDYRQLFTTRDLAGLARINGHASVYWDTPVDGFRVQVDAGRYLAGDDGATLTVARHFAGGWSVGAFATRTTASADDFGEGSYDKGIFVEIPLSAILPYETRETRRNTIRSISGDGGQRLLVEGRLYDRLRPETPQAITGGWGRIAR
jgi:hypothetical protein